MTTEHKLRDSSTVVMTWLSSKSTERSCYPVYLREYEMPESRSKLPFKTALGVESVQKQGSLPEAVFQCCLLGSR